MKWIVALAAGLAAVLGASCGGSSPSTPESESHLQVYVHSEDMEVADKRLQILELAIEKLTDTSGFAEFTVPAGTYTLRAYGLNTGGPPLYLDRAVTTVRGETTRVDLVNCLPCVAPNKGG